MRSFYDPLLPRPYFVQLRFSICISSCHDMEMVDKFFPLGIPNFLES